MVEQWVAAEPRCASSLDVRIVPSDGGLYIIAIDERGHARERVVPDPDSAGALIASWAADPEVAPPGLVMPSAAPMIDTAAPPAKSGERTEHWLSLGVVAGEHELGYRADLDLFVHGPWSIGVAGSISMTRMDVYGGLVDLHEKSFGGYLAFTTTHGRWQVRGSGTVGELWTDSYGQFLATPEQPDYAVDMAYNTPVLQVGVVASYRVWADLHAQAGALFTVIEQDYDFGNGTAYRRAIEGNAYLGLGYHL